MSTRRAVSHAILDALGPATRRNGCVGDAFAPHVAKVFETCLKGFIRRGTCEDEDEDSEKQERSFSEDPSDTQSVGTNLAFSGVCPRVAVRFAKILRVSPALASPFPGAATRMAEALSLAAVADTKKEPRSEGEREGVANENENENESFKSDAPASRAGAVAELLAWSGESAFVPEALFVSLSQLCVDAGHASAAEVLLKTRVDDAHALRARLARTHADAGNHRAARRLAGESLLDELRRDAEEPFAFLPVSPNRVSLDEGVSKETTFCRKGVLASALGDSNESIVLAHDLHSVSRARALLDSAFSRERLSDPRRGQSHRLPTPIVGFDCEWRPGPGDASSNPVTVAQFAMHTGVRKNGHAVVVLDCASVFGPNASFELAAAATSFVKTVFERCLLCGFGVASDARRLAASYPDRFFSCSFGSDGSKQAHEENITVTTVCVRDVSITLGASAQTHASSLSNLCASVLGPNDALDKTEQVSGWDARPLRRSQILYAAYDALAPRCVLVTLLAKRAKRMFEGDVADACVPWTKKETLGAVFLQTLKEKTSASDGACGDFFSSTPPRTDADVRRALTRLGALTRSDEILADADADADADAAECLVMVEGWSTSSLKRTTLLCKTLAVVAESSSDGNVFLAATCVLPAFDSIRLDLAAAAEALLGVDVSSPSPAFRLRLANTNELHELFGFAAGSVGPFGLRDSVKSLRRLTVMDESLFVEENAKKTKLSCGSSLVAVGGGAPDVKVVGTAQAVAKHADASVARLTARNL
jgi:prolyl-tRNA editing enzyme YbaK/EbsC (Cys-tRNA(Pro) deacylase)